MPRFKIKFPLNSADESEAKRANEHRYIKYRSNAAIWKNVQHVFSPGSFTAFAVSVQLEMYGDTVCRIRYSLP